MMTRRSFEHDLNRIKAGKPDYWFLVAVIGGMVVGVVLALLLLKTILTIYYKHARMPC